MATTTEIPPIVKSVRVRARPEHAFAVFTTNVIKWWPPAYTIGQSPMKEVVIEPRIGGRWFEIGNNASECQWGDVLAWNPPSGLTLAWRIGMNWASDPSLLTEVEMSFKDIGGGETEVRINHSKFENYGQDAEKALQIFDGWSSILGRFANVTQGLPPDS